MRFPMIPYRSIKRSQQIVEMHGLNKTDLYNDGSLYDCLNLSSRHYPKLSTRPLRQLVEKYDNCTSIYQPDKVAYVKDGTLFYDDFAIGSVKDGIKQYALVNTKLVIFPDKVYLDINTRELHNLSAELISNRTVYTDSSITVASAQGSIEDFRVGDAVSISGQLNSNKSFIIRSINSKENVITTDSNTFQQIGEDTAQVKLIRHIPDLDYICEKDNRLWGCSNEDGTIYASSLGDPTNFFVYDTKATDSYAVAVGEPGEFTGCCKYNDAVLFFKENSLHKLLGSYPAEYTLYSYDMEGIKKGCYQTLVNVNQTLFYLSNKGVMSYGGNTASKISTVLGDIDCLSACAGTDKEKYYLSVRDRSNNFYFYVFDPTYNIWLLEDNKIAREFALINNVLHFSDNGLVLYAITKEDEDVEWMATYNPFIETNAGTWNTNNAFMNKKNYSKLVIRAEIQGYIICEVKFDDGVWEEVTTLFGNGLKPINIPINRCDRFQIRLKGKGKFKLLNMARVYNVRSDR